MQNMQIGLFGLNIEANKDITEKEFRQKCAGQRGVDVDKAWKDFKKEAKQYQEPKKKKK